MILGIFTLVPLCIMCLDKWKRYVHPAFEIHISVYESLGKLLKGINLRNLTLNIIDNTFNEEKIFVLYNMVSASSLRGLTLLNYAGPYDMKGREYSNFQQNIKPLRELRGVIVDARWEKNCCGSRNQALLKN